MFLASSHFKSDKMEMLSVNQIFHDRVIYAYYINQITRLLEYVELKFNDGGLTVYFIMHLSMYVMRAPKKVRALKASKLAEAAKNVPYTPKVDKVSVPILNTASEASLNVWGNGLWKGYRTVKEKIHAAYDVIRDFVHLSIHDAGKKARVAIDAAHADHWGASAIISMREDVIKHLRYKAKKNRRFKDKLRKRKLEAPKERGSIYGDVVDDDGIDIRPGWVYRMTNL